MIPSARMMLRRVRSPRPSTASTNDEGPEILGVQLEEVPAPVALEHAVELGQDRGEELFGGQRVADRVLPPSAAAAFGAR